MDLQSGMLLPFFLIAIPIVLAIVDVLGIGNSTSAMTQRSAGALPERTFVAPVTPRAAL